MVTCAVGDPAAGDLGGTTRVVLRFCGWIHPELFPRLMCWEQSVTRSGKVGLSEGWTG